VPKERSRRRGDVLFLLRGVLVEREGGLSGRGMMSKGSNEWCRVSDSFYPIEEEVESCGVGGG